MDVIFIAAIVCDHSFLASELCSLYTKHPHPSQNIKMKSKPTLDRVMHLHPFCQYGSETLDQANYLLSCGRPQCILQQCHDHKWVLTKGNEGFPDELSFMFNDWDLAIRVDLWDEPVWLHLQMDVNLFSGDVLGSCNQTYTLQGYNNH